MIPGIVNGSVYLLYNNKKLIGFEKNVKLQWSTEDINKTGIIGNPINANSKKGKGIRR